MTAEFSDRLTALSDALLSRSESLVTAESCTGGWLAKVCTDLAGSSGWFERGLVTYSNQAKQDLLGVSASTLEQQGAVSEATVREMASGALDNSTAQHAVAISGIAGPGGGSMEKPVGTVWLAWASRHGSLLSRQYRFSGGRDAVRRQAVAAALDGLLERLG